MKESTFKNDSQGIDPDVILQILSPNGPLTSRLKGFEAREEQKHMLRNVLDAYNKSHIAMVEAGTGTGKSLAYLIPALLWAAHTKERTVISTNTITLQEQLLLKDIPLLLKALGLELKAVLVKGMSNYVCLRKLEECQHELLLYTAQEAEDLQKIHAWSENTQDGSRASIPFATSGAVWEKISAENDTCNRNKCPYYQKCHFFKARNKAADAQILIVNHHLLFADLVVRSQNDSPREKEAGILPPYNRLIIDEAHNIEDIATDYFASHISQMDILRVMARLTADKGGKVHGKLPLLRERLIARYKNDLARNITTVLSRLSTDLPATRHDLLKQTMDTFEAFRMFSKEMSGSKSLQEENPNVETKLRILKQHTSHTTWQNTLIPQAKQLIEGLQRYAQMLKSLHQDVKDLDKPEPDDMINGILFEINALSLRIVALADILSGFMGPISAQKVRWIESQILKTFNNTSLFDADLDISKILAHHLFGKFATVILCSATLTTNNDFSFFRLRLGLTKELLPQKQVHEFVYPSPFDYAKQALLIIPNDLPNPSDPKFIQEASERIWKALVASRGNAFVLFTSYSMLKICFELLNTRMQQQRFHPLKQGDDDRLTLLNKFRSTDRSVLFGTDSFWEGVDVAGEALRCVIIVKLPFKVPTEPLIQARSEAITSKGGDSFMEYSLPQAIVKFKQGFGRLIRHKQDRGCIICLDNRITTKKYGQKFLNSVPKCQEAFVPSHIFPDHMDDFYRKTYYLVKK